MARKFRSRRRNFKKKSFRRRKSQRRIGRIGNGRRTIPRSLFPNRKLVSLNYACGKTLTPPGTANLTSFRIACNGLYAPEITGGHQPLMFDQLAVAYAKMTVIGARIICTYSAAATTTDLAYVIGIHRNPNLTSPPSSFLTYAENGNARFKTVTFGQGSPSHTMTMNFSTRKHMSVVNVLDDDDLASNSAANPLATAGFDVFCQPADQGTVLPALVVNVRVQYIALCSDPIPVASS